MCIRVVLKDVATKLLHLTLYCIVDDMLCVCHILKTYIYIYIYIYIYKGKAVALQAWSGPEGSRKLSSQILHDNGAGW